MEDFGHNPVSKPEYERLGFDHALCTTAVDVALQSLGIDRPTLFYGKNGTTVALKIAAALASHRIDINAVLHHALDPDEWFVEWCGKRYGSNP